MMSQRPTGYAFGYEYKVKLLALCVRLPLFLLSHRDTLEPVWFEDPTLMDLAREILSYFDKYRKPPTMEALEEVVMDLLATSPQRNEKADDYTRALESMKSASLDDSEFLTEKVCAFASYMAHWNALQASAEDVDAGKYDAVYERFRKASLVGKSKTDLGVNYFTDKTRFQNQRVMHTITTGLPGLDKLLSGGWAPGELVVIEAPTGIFKTGAMCNFAAAALKFGCDVVYMSLEIPIPEVCRRIDGALLQKVTHQCNEESLFREIQAKQQEMQSSLWVNYWPMGTANISTLRAYLYNLLAEGHIRKGKRKLALFCDYGALLKPAQHYNDRRHEVNQSYLDLLTLGQEFEAPMITGMQTNRAAEGKTLITKADLAECYAVAGHAQIILSLNQTKAEIDRDEMRVFVAKSRETKSFKHIDVLCNKELTHWTEMLVQSGTGDVAPDSAKALQGPVASTQDDSSSKRKRIFA